MKKALFSMTVVLLCASVAQAMPLIYVTPSNPTPVSGSTVTFTLTYDGSADGLGLLYANANAVLNQESGLGTWDTPTNPQILVPALAAGSEANVGTLVANGIDNVLLSINLTSFPLNKTIGASGPVNVYSADVKVYGAPGDRIGVYVIGQDNNQQGVAVFMSNSLVDVVFPPYPAGVVNGIVAFSEVTIAVPEPVTLTVFGIGLGGLALFRRRR